MPPFVDGAVTVVPVGSGPIKYEFATSIQLDSSGSAGPSPTTTIAISNWNSHHLERDGWSVEVVDDQGDAGRHASLAHDKDGAPHIAYYVAESSDSGTVRHARKDGSGWQIENVGELQNVRMGHTGARKITSLAFDPEGGLHLAYSDRDQLIYAQRDG